MKGIKVATNWGIGSSRRGHPAKNKLRQHLIKIKKSRRSYPPDIGDELVDLGYEPQNDLKREIAAAQKNRRTGLLNAVRPPLKGEGNKESIFADVSEKKITRRMRKRINEQLQRGKRQSERGELTFVMERYLRKHGISIEVRPQRWKRKEAF